MSKVSDIMSFLEKFRMTTKYLLFYVTN